MTQQDVIIPGPGAFTLRHKMSNWYLRAPAHMLCINRHRYTCVHIKKKERNLSSNSLTPKILTLVRRLSEWDTCCKSMQIWVHILPSMRDLDKKIKTKSKQAERWRVIEEDSLHSPLAVHAHTPCRPLSSSKVFFLLIAHIFMLAQTGFSCGNLSLSISMIIIIVLSNLDFLWPFEKNYFPPLGCWSDWKVLKALKASYVPNCLLIQIHCRPRLLKTYFTKGSYMLQPPF